MNNTQADSKLGCYVEPFPCVRSFGLSEIISGLGCLCPPCVSFGEMVKWYE